MGFGFRVNLGHRVQDLGLENQGMGPKTPYLNSGQMRVRPCLKFLVWGLGLRV
jgi:hypothetical protein